MKLIYLDEAGNTGSKADPDQPIHMIGSLIVDQAHVRSIEVRLNELAERCRTLIRAAGHPAPSDPIEFHGADIFGGQGPFRPIDPGARITICEDIITACRDGEAAFGYCAVDKMKLRDRKKPEDGHPHMRCFQFTLERLQDRLENDGELGLLIADEHRELEEEIIKSLAFSKEFTTGWGYRPTAIENIIDTVHFVKSRHNRLVQACDVLTYFKLKGLRLSRKLLSAYRLSAEQAGGMSYGDYVASHAKSSDNAVLRLDDTIRAMECFQKLWPLYT